MSNPKSLFSSSKKTTHCIGRNFLSYNFFLFCCLSFHVLQYAQTVPLVSKAMKKLHSKGGSSSSSIHPESPPPSSMSGSGKPTSTTTTTTATKGMESMFFKFSDKVTRTSKVDKAHLWLYLNGASSPSASTTKIATNISVWIHVYKVSFFILKDHLKSKIQIIN